MSGRDEYEPEWFQFEEGQSDDDDSPMSPSNVPKRTAYAAFPSNENGPKHKVPELCRVLDPGEIDKMRILSVADACNVLSGTLLEEMKPKFGTATERQQSIEVTLEYLLSRYKWRIRVLGPDMIESPKRVLTKCELRFGDPQIPRATCITPYGIEQLFFCEICKEYVAVRLGTALPCGHFFCNKDWNRFLSAAVTEGPETAVFKSCPQFKCPYMVTEATWQKLAPPDTVARQNQFRRQLYVSSHPFLRSCVTPDCPNATQALQIQEEDANFRIGQGRRQPTLGTARMTCGCGNSFCFFCGEEPHRPVPCDIISVWIQKNNNEAANVAWILVNTRNCPSCKQPIEKNQGCMHMTCRCKHEFCWMCLTDWKKHQGSDFWTCNVYKEKPQDSTEAVERQRAKESLERYSHYFERFRAHNHAQRVAQVETLADVEMGIRRSSARDSTSPDASCRSIASAATALASLLPNDEAESEAAIGLLELLREAVFQIIECRRILKFSYAFGYYASWSRKPQNKSFFEYQQGILWLILTAYSAGELERTLDSLQELATADTLLKFARMTLEIISFSGCTITWTKATILTRSRRDICTLSQNLELLW